MKAKSIIFDLDGTLVDSLPGIEASVHHSLRECSPPRTLPPIRSVIGPPIAKMYAQLWPDMASERLAGLVTRFRQHYDAEGCLLSQLYPGVLQTLMRLNEKAALFVLTNKPAQASNTILGHLGILQFFDEVVSPDAREPAFLTKIEGAQYLQKRHVLETPSTFLVGDGTDDLAAARACGFAFVAAAYGYGGVSTQDEEDGLMVKSFPNILDIVL